LPRHQINVIGLAYRGARFHQQIMYWQYPHLPWLNLVQRNSNANNTFKMNELESKALLKDWQENFQNVFQLLRNLQRTYFYVLTKRFTVLWIIIYNFTMINCPHTVAFMKHHGKCSRILTITFSAEGIF
jgi:ABC-type lipoprotein release transport system permease subunit